MRVHWIGEPAPDQVERVVAGLDSAVQLRVGALTEMVDVLVGGVPGDGDLALCQRALVIPYAGLAARTRARLLKRPDLLVYNLHHNAASVAELALALVLAAGKCLLPMDRSLRGHDWRPRYDDDPGISFSGGRAVVVGCGDIGSRVCTALTALGLQVVGVRRRPTGAAEVGPHALAEALVGARVVVVCAPLTDETEGLLGSEELALLAEPAVLVNVGRAAIVDEGALFEAARSGRLRVGLDVWYRYPSTVAERAATAPSALPFEDLDSVVLSPHRAGHGAAVEALRESHLVTLLNSLAAGGRPPSRVDVEAGY